MKLYKSRWVMVLGGIVAVVIIASLGTVYAQQLHNESQLKQDINLAEQRINKVPIDELLQKKDSLEQQIAQTNADFENMKAELSAPAETVGAVYTLFDIAARSGVQIDEISSATLPGEDLAGLKFSVLVITMRIRGELDDIIECITFLNWGLTNGTVKSTDIDETKAGELPTATIKLFIYSYKGN